MGYINPMVIYDSMRVIGKMLQIAKGGIPNIFKLSAVRSKPKTTKQSERIPFN